MFIEGWFAWVVWALVTPIVLLILRRRRHLSSGHLIAIGVFGAYLAGVAAYTFFPLRIDTFDLAGPGFDPVIVLQPFFLGRLDAMSPLQYAGNILLGIPFGLLAPFVRRTPLRWVVLSGLGFSLVIEATQWVLTRIGIAYPARAVDVSDILLNTFGVILGIGAFVLLRIAYRAVIVPAAHRPEAMGHIHATLAG